MAKKKPKKKSSKNQLKNWLIQKLRRISYQWPPRKEAIKLGRVSRGKYRCALCKGENFGPKEIQLDHILPVIDVHTGFIDYNTYIDRLFCDVGGWQICCRPCHQTKSNYEQIIRKQAYQKSDSVDDGDI